MLDVIDFLEGMGQDAQLRYATAEQVAATLESHAVDAKLREVMLAKDAQGLGVMLGKGPYCCYIEPGKEDEDEKKKDDKDKDKDKDKGKGKGKGGKDGKGDKGKVKKSP